MARNKRQQKKFDDQIRDVVEMEDWWLDLRAYALEAMFENIDLRIIADQFKRRFTTRGVSNRYFQRTRMQQWINGAMDM